MEREKLDKLKERLEKALPDAEIIIQPNTVSGINVKIVSVFFKELSQVKRKEWLDQVLPGEEVAFYELLTPEENKIFGTDLKDLRPEDLPFWPNVLSNPIDSEIRFLNTVDEFPNPPLIVTFYSIRGGVGRTTSLGYTAYNLERKGYRVVTVDMDLEAPGLPDILGITFDDRERTGLVPLLYDLEQQEHIDIRNYMARMEDREIYCLPAGKVNTEYIHLLHQLNFPQFYRFKTNPLQKVFEMIGETLGADVILIDARTGFSEINGPLLFDLADLAVITFFPHPQTKEAFRLLTQGILNHKNRRGYTPEMRFIISPVPASDENDKYLQRGIEWIDEIGDTIRRRMGKVKDIEEVFKPEEITTVIRYNEDIAFSDKTLLKPNILQIYAPISEWIEKFVYTSNNQDENSDRGIDQTEKKKILDSLRISTGQAEEQDNIAETFIKTKDYFKLLEPNTLLVIGRKGTGKTALFRMLLQENGQKFIPVKIMAPSKLYGNSLYLDRIGFTHIEGILKKYDLPWNTFWQIYILLRIYLERPDLYRGTLSGTMGELCNHPSQSRLIQFLEDTLKQEKISFLIQDEMQELSQIIDKPIYLLFDGLDAGFGSSAEDLKRRERAITGLFELWYDWDGRYHNVRFKIFLRKDIWDKISFQNQSHVWGRDIRISWDQVNYIKTIGKQVLRNDQFVSYLQKEFPSLKIEDWDPDEVWTLLRYLVGERMKGGNTTYTRNWIWNRLADGKGDHSPRYLFQLFYVAIELEKEELRIERNPYLRSLIRPRMLTNSLPKVSEEAVRALREEYPELEQFMDHIKGKMSPLFLQDIKPFEDQIETATEAGLLGVYQKDEGAPLRYAVPDLYLKGLEMTRKGQA